MNLDEMELISNETDFRGWKTYTVKGSEEVIRFYFNNTTNLDLFDVAVLTLGNLEDTYEVKLIPKEQN
jgi:hypothetical protein